jgi:hypothetical protein
VVDLYQQFPTPDALGEGLKYGSFMTAAINKDGHARIISYPPVKGFKRDNLLQNRPSLLPPLPRRI